jgi:CYTH domain-containing protein
MIEIERKYLLKGMPDVEPSEKIKIQQFYFKNKEGIWERARQMDYGQGVKIFVHTIKTRISDIANDEQEKTLTVEEFEKFKKKCRKYRGNSRFLKKERWIYPMGELKWEIDLFKDDINMVIAEIEIPSEDYEVEIPEYVQKKLLMDVSGMKQFGNRSLSNKMK